MQRNAHERDTRQVQYLPATTASPIPIDIEAPLPLGTPFMAFQPTDDCVICMDAAVKVTINPCGHKVICETCCRTLNSRDNKLCPICRAEITGYVCHTQGVPA